MSNNHLLSMLRRGRATSGGGGGGSGILLATFSATDHPETGGNLDRWTQNGVEGYNRAFVQRAAFSGSPSGSHAYRMRWWDSIAGSGLPTGARAEFGLILPADYGDDLRLTWDQYIPEGEHGPALNLIPTDGLGQFKILRAWPLLEGETISNDGSESYGGDGKMGFSEFTNGITSTYAFRYYDVGGNSSGLQGGDPWFIPQHPVSGAKDALYNNPVNRGVWMPMKARLKIADVDVVNETGPSTGIAQLWINDVLTNISATDLRNYPGPTQSRDWRYVYIVGARDTNTYTDECVWIDNIRVYKGDFT